MQDPAKSQEVMAQAMELRQKMVAESGSSDARPDASVEEDLTEASTAVLKAVQDWSKWQTELNATNMDALLRKSCWRRSV